MWYEMNPMECCIIEMSEIEANIDVSIYQNV